MAWSSGIGSYIRNLLPAVARMSPDWRFTAIMSPGANAAWINLPNVSVATARSAIYTVREQLELPFKIPRDADAVWATHYNVPLLPRRRLMVTVHDLAHLRLPEFTGSALKRAYTRVMFGRVRRADGILFDSRFTEGEFVSLVGPPAGVSAVVHLGIAEEWFARPLDEAAAPPESQRQPYFVYVGNVKPHKGVRTLLEAFEIVRGSMDAGLVIIGRHEDLRTADRTIAARAAALQVPLLGELPGAEVRRYVRHATGLVLPSTYEGFGFPPLEAMAAGCPAIVSRAGSLPEVCRDAALYVSPGDAAALAEAMLSVARDGELRRRLISRGVAHARRFDWATAAAATRAVLARVLSA